MWYLSTWISYTYEYNYIHSPRAKMTVYLFYRMCMNQSPGGTNLLFFSLLAATSCVYQTLIRISSSFLLSVSVCCCSDRCRFLSRLCFSHFFCSSSSSHPRLHSTPPTISLLLLLVVKVKDFPIHWLMMLVCNEIIYRSQMRYTLYNL